MTLLGHSASLSGSEGARSEGRRAGKENRDTSTNVLGALELAGGSAQFMGAIRAQARANDTYGVPAGIGSSVHVLSNSVSPVRRRNGKDVATDWSHSLSPSPNTRARSGSMSPSPSEFNFFGALSIEEKLLKIEQERSKIYAPNQGTEHLTTSVPPTGVRGLTECGRDSSTVAARTQEIADECREKERSNRKTKWFRGKDTGKDAKSVADVGKNPARNPNATFLSAVATTIQMLREDVCLQSADASHSHGRGKRQLFSHDESESAHRDPLSLPTTTARLAAPGQEAGVF